MPFNTGYKAYRKWLKKNVVLSELTSPPALKRLTLNLLLGKNYRVITEENTRGKLLATYSWLVDLQRKAIKRYGKNWQVELLNHLLSLDELTVDEKNLAYWLVGLTRKTAQNLDISIQELPEFLNEAVSYCTSLFSQGGYMDYRDEAWLLLMAGAATLNIRGSQKSLTGKAVERVFLRASLTLLGLRQGKDFWTAIPSDVEVVRETDAEVETKRGRIRIDMGLIAEGNPEVITDKVNRVGRHGIVIFDKIGVKARVVHETAQQLGVKLIQIRHNQPLVELYRHLRPLVRVPLIAPPSSEDKLQHLVDALPESLFQLTK